MTNLCFQAILRYDSRKSAESLALQIDAGECAAPMELWCDTEGRLRAGHQVSRASGDWLLASLVSRSTGVNADPTWWMAPRSGHVALNGVRPLQLASVEPGDLLTAGLHRWLVTTRWAPEPIPAPASVASRDCPVCGGALSLAPVIRCPCGRFYHLEEPASPDNPEALNCYLSGPCNLCHRPPSLESRYIPSIREKLLV